MVHHRLAAWRLVFLILAGLSARTVDAAVIQFTGNVVNDFNAADPNHVTTQVIPVNPDPQALGQWPTTTGNGNWVTGWNIKDIYTSYDASTGTLYVGIDNWANKNGQIAPFGQANGDPSGTPTPYDPAHLGYGTTWSDKSIALMFAPTNPANPTIPGAPLIIAGIPADKSKNGPGIDGFTVSSVDLSRASGGLAYLFGSSLPHYTGNLAFDPSPSHPQLEFTIKNFGQLINPANGFWLEGFAGSALDRYVGKTNLGWTKIPSSAEQNIPEPATWVAWTLAAGAATWRFRSRSKNRARA
jgi:hypothetical protein